MARKILLIDDDRMQFSLTRQLFKAFVASHYELEWKATYEEGLEALLHGDYEACLLDYRLGPRDGLELIREATERECRVPIIFLTAETGSKVDIEAMNAGALDYLVKGEFSAPMLERSLRYALKLAKTLEALRQLATRDELTGLLNRRVFENILREEMERSQRFGRSFALTLLDIDHFKNVNDTHGHPVGDIVLREVAQRLQGALRSVDRVMRYGGEEFVVLMLESDLAMATTSTERMCAAIRNKPVAAGELSLPITISAGMAVFPHDGANRADIVQAADQALYAAKTRGRNRAVAFQDCVVR
ncbi:MAG: GGDEF domain-containing response regulator [Cephaloticoccus sp.]|nr:GGDEF domain-containing response regulator [Cephaloticoccus sp.]MCF7759309.1 GGDEF domain-containing response regulator [Cephaloticoccus sp.]